MKTMKTILTSSQRGMSMIEVLVAIVILGLGALGIAALQARALKGNESSVQRTQAVIAANYLLDAVRSDNSLLIDGDMTCDGGEGLFATWLLDLQTNMGAGSCGQIECKEITTANSAKEIPLVGTNLCTVTVQWDDSRIRGGNTTEQLQLRTLLTSPL